MTDPERTMCQLIEITGWTIPQIKTLTPDEINMIIGYQNEKGEIMQRKAEQAKMQAEAERMTRKFK